MTRMANFTLVVTLALGVFACNALLAAPYTPDAYTVLLFHFDEAAGTSMPQDSSFNGNHATAGPLATGDTGFYDKATEYTQASGINQIDDDPSFDAAQTAGSISFLIKLSETSFGWGSDQDIVRKNDGGSNAGDFSVGVRMNPLTYGGGQFYLIMEDGNGSYRKLSTPNMVSTTDWYHVVVEWDSVNTPTITVNDALQTLSDGGTNTTYVGPIFTASDTLLVGIGNDGNDPGEGLLDELRIQAIPEPTTLAVLGLGGLVAICRRRRKK